MGGGYRQGYGGYTLYIARVKRYLGRWSGIWAGDISYRQQGTYGYIGSGLRVYAEGREMWEGQSI